MGEYSVGDCNHTFVLNLMYCSNFFVKHFSNSVSYDKAHMIKIAQMHCQTEKELLLRNRTKNCVSTGQWNVALPRHLSIRHLYG